MTPKVQKVLVLNTSTPFQHSTSHQEKVVREQEKIDVRAKSSH
jgi:hypothetical protein